MPHPKMGRHDNRNRQYKNLTIMQKRKIKQNQKAQKICKTLYDMESTEKTIQPPMKIKQVCAETDSNLEPLSITSIPVKINNWNPNRHKIISLSNSTTPHLQAQKIFTSSTDNIEIANYTMENVQISEGQHVADAIELESVTTTEEIYADDDGVLNNISPKYPNIESFKQELEAIPDNTKCPVQQAKKILWDKFNGLTNTEIEKLLQYRKVFIPDAPGQPFTFMKTPPASVAHDENMPMEIKPPYKKFHNFEKQQALDEYVADGLRSGLLEYVQNPTMASPAVILQKKDGTHRFLCDPRHINKHLRNVLTPAPDISNSTRNIASCKFWSKVDLKNAFLRQKVKPEHRKFSAFVVPTGPHSGIIQFVGLGVGLKNSTSIFVENLNTILRPLKVARNENGTLVNMVTYEIFVDDLISGGKTRHEAFQSLLIILAQLYKFNVKLDAKKTEFITTKLEWCGNIIQNNQIKPDPDRFQKLDQLQIPSSLDPTHTQWRRVFGLYSYYRKYLPRYADREQQIRNILSNCKENTITKEDKDKQIAEIISEFVMDIKNGCLTVPPENCELLIQTDASNLAQAFVVSAIVEKDGKRTAQPCWFGSKILDKVQQTYKTHEKELLAIITALDSCKHFISRASSVEVESDNLTNVILLNNNGAVNELSGRALRLILQVQNRISSEKIKFKHLTTLANFVADAASRLEFNEDRNAKLSKSLQDSGNDDANHSGTICVLTRAQRAKEFNFNEVQSIHQMTHCGKQKLYKTCKDYYKMNHNNLEAICNEVVDSCKACNQYKRVLASTVQGIIQLPPNEFHTLVIDHVHLPVKTKMGNKYIITAVCEFSRYLFAVAVPDKSMKHVAGLLKLIIQLFPQIIAIRGDLAFDCQEIKNLPVKEVEYSAAHNSRSNIGERCHRTLWEKIKVQQEEQQLTNNEEIDIVLPKAVSAYNNQYHASIDAKPAQFLMGDGSLIKNANNLSAKHRKLRNRVRDLQKMKVDQASSKTIPSIPEGTEVLIRYHAKQRNDIVATVLEDQGYVVKVQKHKAGRYSVMRVAKRHIFIKKQNQSCDIYEKFNTTNCEQ